MSLAPDSSTLSDLRQRYNRFLSFYPCQFAQQPLEGLGEDIRKDTLSQDLIVLFGVVVGYRRDFLALSSLPIDSFQTESKIFSEVQRGFSGNTMSMSRIQRTNVTHIRSIVKDIRLNQARDDVVVES